MKKDFYAILGVSRKAAPREIERAYLKLARRLHPDVNPVGKKVATEFRRLQEAYRTLADPESRRIYDRTGKGAAHAGEKSGKRDKTSLPGDPREWENIFRDIFHDEKVREPETAAEPGEDIHQVLEISFEESLARTRRQIAYQREVVCSHCDGSRYEPDTKLRTCPDCEGSGLVSLQRGPYQAKKICHECTGTGETGDVPCRGCHGKGKILRREKKTISLSPGIDSGTSIVVPGGGYPGKGGGGYGDLIVTVRVAPHPLLERKGYNLYTSILVTVAEAALGTALIVPAAGEKVSLKIPPGTQAAQQFCIRGKGVPRQSGKVGDLYVAVQIVVPTAKDAKSRRLFREIERLFPENPRLRG